MEDARAYLTRDAEKAYIAEEAEPEDNILTVHDTQLSKQTYDAFVLFADHDLEFATELIENLETSGIKLCVKDRDLVAGSFEHEAVMKLISERCNRMIVLISPEFLKSSANKFFVNFAQSLGIHQRRRKIIPCLIRSCILPPTLSYYFVLNYERSGKLYDFWVKLKESIQEPAENSNM